MVRHERRSNAWSSAERISAVRTATDVNHRRVEILALIARLQQHAGTEQGAPGIARVGERNGARTANGNSEATPSAVPSDGGSIARAATSALNALRDLERRVHRLEQRNGESLRPSRTSVRPEERTSIRPEALTSIRPAAKTSTAPGPERSANAVISGIIQGQLLSDVLQLVSSNSMTGVFSVECRRAKTVLYFDDGRIVHAAGQGLEGEQAFFSIFAFDGGRYHFEETHELPAQRTINSNTQFLILEALRQIDESRAD
jgi:hypothetical protein